jgi:hypothetical protein
VGKEPQIAGLARLLQIHARKIGARGVGRGEDDIKAGKEKS